MENENQNASSESVSSPRPALEADDYAPCPDPRCNDHLGAIPIPQCVTSVAWAEEADQLRRALQGLVDVIVIDDLIPESVSYMKQARAALAAVNVPERETETPTTGVESSVPDEPESSGTTYGGFRYGEKVKLVRDEKP